eukprot:CAMPEP_0182461312 /NCGR_PEP_ID=MMETSP1319-20130603/5924_1 /TAXON_ID=172717 /ORGANISM="Bolidomonas pacifica, Strain RCC208" /LENGTH=283 /DNA_ID=CAMNT_0024660583 /DNA_START=25 /DNA_END=873 /DNA_ORIENTATION=-
MKFALLSTLFALVGANSNNSTTTTTQSILVAGDSWGTVLAGGSAANLSFLSRKLKEHGCPNDVTNIAIPGTTATQWSNADGSYLAALTKAAPKHSHVWITLMGNDALEQMPTCAASGKTSDECGDQLYSDMLAKMGSIVDAVHDANPDAEVVGMGYEMMFGGAGCGLIPATLFPQCWKGEADSSDESSIRCFNTQVVRMQAVWDEVASSRPYATSLNILGLTQTVDGDEAAAVGEPNMEKLGPSWAWPVYEGCIHPGVAGAPEGSAENSASMVLMEEMYAQYW